MKVHVIIPVGPADSSVLTLLHDLMLLDVKPASVTVSFSRSEDEVMCRFLLNTLSHSGVLVHTVCGKPGRSKQQNEAFRRLTSNVQEDTSVVESVAARFSDSTVAPDDYLWFLHSDSRIEKKSLTYLAVSLASNPDGLHYFNLKFQDDGSRLMRINTIGVWIRSHLMFMPFGDQGLCLKVKYFKKLGMFDEKISRGEDHDLVWKANVEGIPLTSVHANIVTSARNYDGHWFSTTLLTMKASAKQALPYVPKVVKGKLSRLMKSKRK